LKAEHRLALTGTPIENRLLDLSSIFGFAMAGALGNRPHFHRRFDAKKVKQRGWPHFIPRARRKIATNWFGNFNLPKAAVFLISLTAGGFGLNLTAASYVVLFDPWWNPAAENQAIDRTHRIEQTSKVMAYRLLMRESIEQKIRALQKQRAALAADVLGEERFAQSRTLQDLRFFVCGRNG
jgi:SNF2 family DNA or RNA helicase